MSSEVETSLILKQALTNCKRFLDFARNDKPRSDIAPSDASDHAATLKSDGSPRSSPLMPPVLERRQRFRARALVAVRRRKKSRRSRLRLVILLLLVGVSLGGWYLARKGFGGNGATIVEELHKRGVEASFGDSRSIRSADLSRKTCGFSITKP